MELTQIVWMFLLGGAIAMTVVYYNSRFLGGFVRKLLEIDATSPDTAMTPDELGIKITPALQYALRKGSGFSDIVLKTNDGRYYIAENRVELAKIKFKDKSTTIFVVILSIAVIGLFGLAFTYIFPDILSNALQQFSEVF